MAKPPANGLGELRQEVKDFHARAASMLVAEQFKLAVLIREPHLNNIVTYGRCARDRVKAIARIVRDERGFQRAASQKCRQRGREGGIDVNLPPGVIDNSVWAG